MTEPLNANSQNISVKYRSPCCARKKICTTRYAWQLGAAILAAYRLAFKDEKTPDDFAVYPWLDTNEMMPDYVSDTGWADLIADLLNQIDSLVAGTPTKLILLQVKEKMGTLRLYYRLVDVEPQVARKIADVVSKAYYQSREICFKCGLAGSMRNLSGWIVPTCDAHATRDALD